MVVEFTIITDILTTLPNGKLKVTKKNARIIRAFDSSNITYQTYLNSKGIAIKKYTTIICGNEYIQVDHPMEYVKKKLGHYEVTGYAAKAKYNKSKKV